MNTRVRTYFRSRERKIEDVKQYLSLLNKYIDLVKGSADSGDQEHIRMEELRQQLLLGKSRMRSLVGGCHYRQFGMVFSAWNGLSKSPDMERLQIISDALVTKLGELASHNQSDWSIYEITNPIYWMVSLWKWLRGNTFERLSESFFSKFWTRTAKAIYVLAAVATIVSGVVAFVR